MLKIKKNSNRKEECLINSLDTFEERISETKDIYKN